MHCAPPTVSVALPQPYPRDYLHPTAEKPAAPDCKKKKCVCHCEYVRNPLTARNCGAIAHQPLAAGAQRMRGGRLGVVSRAQAVDVDAGDEQSSDEESEEEEPMTEALQRVVRTEMASAFAQVQKAIPAAGAGAAAPVVLTDAQARRIAQIIAKTDTFKETMQQAVKDAIKDELTDGIRTAIESAFATEAATAAGAAESERVAKLKAEVAQQKKVMATLVARVMGGTAEDQAMAALLVGAIGGGGGGGGSGTSL